MISVSPPRKFLKPHQGRFGDGPGGSLRRGPDDGVELDPVRPDKVIARRRAFKCPGRSFRPLTNRISSQMRPRNTRRKSISPAMIFRCREGRMGAVDSPENALGRGVERRDHDVGRGEGFRTAGRVNIELLVRTTDRKSGPFF